MRYSYTRHVRIRIRQRGLSARQIEATISMPDRLLPSFKGRQVAMDITFDHEADALYIQFQPSKRVKRTIKLRDGLLVDLDASGRIFGIELLDVSSRMPIEQLGRVRVNLPVHA